MLYTIVHTVINNKGEHPEANARVLGIYSNEDVEIVNNITNVDDIQTLQKKRKNGLRIQRLLT